MSKFHSPVMIDEIVEYLRPTEGRKYIDATLGGGGHSKALVDRGGEVLGIDQDPEAIDFVAARTDLDQSRIIIIEENFENISQVAKANEFDRVDGTLFDLGVSSYQFDKPERGFSFQADAPLDMRMSPKLAVTAKDLVNGLGKKELYGLFTKLAQERFSRQIADAIISARQIKPIETTGELARIVSRVYANRKTGLHPATKVFQSLRIAVNDEINILRSALPLAFDLLKPGGRLIVISFHEGEDRVVKLLFKDLGQAGEGKVLSKKPLVPLASEVADNPRSRSAKMRVVEKV